MVFTEKELLDYACMRFQEEMYDEALEAFILAYSKGYEQKWVIENIYSCYMAGNEEEFRRTYKRQEQGQGIAYEDCTLDFIPYRDGEYYIFDKEIGIFLGVFSVHELQETKPDLYFENAEFSAVVLEMGWNWNEEKEVLSEAKRRKVYVVSHDLKRCISFYKLPELEEYVKNIKIFENHQQFQDYFHKNTSVYLPKIVCGREEHKKKLYKIIEEEHQHRLTPEGRNTENVLLTIGIPTHDRGNLLRKRIENLIRCPYDAEIEFAISKNGTHYYQEEYKSVEKIPDARINYVGYDYELTMSKNWQNVVKIAHGKFVMMVSDEDDVILDALEHYLNLLNAHEALGMVRTKTELQYNFINEDKYCKKGKDAFYAGFLGQNYLSGAIYNRKLFLESNIESWNQKYEYNEFYRQYPHMWWQVILAFKGDYAVDKVCMIREGDSVLLEETLKYREDGVEEGGLAAGGTDPECPDITTVSTYSARLEQFRGGILLIRDFEELDGELKINALLTLVNKTLFLMDLVRDEYHYKEAEFPLWVDKLIGEVINAMKELDINSEDQKQALSQILGYIKDLDKDLEKISC